jgi:hypothetical protein
MPNLAIAFKLASADVFLAAGWVEKRVRERYG